MSLRNILPLLFFGNRTKPQWPRARAGEIGRRTRLMVKAILAAVYTQRFVERPFSQHCSPENWIEIMGCAGIKDVEQRIHHETT